MISAKSETVMNLLAGEVGLNFFIAILLGIFFALIYDIFKSLRLEIRHGAFLVAVEDVLFFLMLT